MLLSFIEFPLLPGVTWLKYDASAMPAMVCGFAFGPGRRARGGRRGRPSSTASSWRDFSGAVMNILVVTWLRRGPPPLLYRRARTFKSGVVGLVVSVRGRHRRGHRWATCIITPCWLGVPLDAVMRHDRCPSSTPFNLVEGGR